MSNAIMINTRKLFWGVVVLVSIFLHTICVYNIGYSKGGDAGAGQALDTINKIVQKQLKSDTSVTRLILINPDTNTYILSRKTALLN
jgi:hypothetical protein